MTADPLPALLISPNLPQISSLLKHFSLFLNFLAASRATRKTAEIPKEAMNHKSSLDFSSPPMLDGVIAWSIEEKREEERRRERAKRPQEERKGGNWGAPSKSPKKNFCPAWLWGI